MDKNHLPSYKASNERYTISEAIAIIQSKGYGKIMLGYRPTYGLQILLYVAVVVGKRLDRQLHLQTDRHTDSGDLSPTRTCVPYVLLAIV